MEIIFVLALNAIAITAVWFITKRRNTSTEDSSTELQTAYSQLELKHEELKHEHIKLNAKSSFQSEKLAELQEQVEREKTNSDDLNTRVLELSADLSSHRSQLKSKDLIISEQSQNIAEYKEFKEKSISKIGQTEKEKVSLQEQLKSREQKIEELTQSIADIKGTEELLEQRLKTQFEMISHKIIEESRNKVNEFNASRIQELMTPLKKDIKDFKEEIKASHSEQSKERISLETQIKHMVQISQGMSAEAKNLSKALRGNNKTAGNWGETILENILQSSGLTQGKEGYELQITLRDGQGKAIKHEESERKMVPDAVVHFPDNRHVIIDSKVSITAYTDYCNAESEDERQLYLKRHVESIKTHIKGLSVKNYEQYVDGSLDFVMMFIPNDFAAMVALQGDLNLWQHAYNHKILIISPTNLITSLKIVSDLWSREKQQRNIDAILKRGLELHKKCCSFISEYETVGKKISEAQSSYEKARGLLQGKGGIVRQVELLEKVGAKSNKNLAVKSEESEVGDDDVESVRAIDHAEG